MDKLDIDNFKDVPTNLNNLKSKVDKLDVDKLVPEVKNKIPNITNLATSAALTAAENKIPNVSNLDKKN